MRQLLIVLGLLLASCSNTLESTEVAQFEGKKYIIKVSEYDSGLVRNADVFINNKLAYQIAPKSIKMDKSCTKVFSNGYTITCPYSTTFEGKKLDIKHVFKSSLLALSVNYEVYLDGQLVEVVNTRNK